MKEETLLELFGGRPVIERINKLLYDRLYGHPWIKCFFKNTKQENIESQHTDFMISKMGGGPIYSGQLPGPAHQHIFISDEIYDLRCEILRDCLVQSGISEELIDRYFQMENTFRDAVVKKGPEECKKRFFTDEIIIADKPKTW